MVNRAYFINSEHLSFSYWRADDYGLAKRLWSNEDVCHYICANAFFSDEEIKERLNREIDNQLNYGIQYWPIFDLKTEDFAGCCGFRPYKEGIYELGFHLLPEYWHKGLAYEAANTAISYLFENTDIKELSAGHHPNNLASASVLKKLGFECIGEEFYGPTGLYHPTYRLKKSDYVRS